MTQLILPILGGTHIALEGLHSAKKNFSDASLSKVQKIFWTAVSLGKAALGVGIIWFVVGDFLTIQQTQRDLEAYPVEKNHDNPFAFNTTDWEKKSPKLVWLNSSYDFNNALNPASTFQDMESVRANYDVQAKAVSHLDDICNVTAALEEPATMVINTHGNLYGIKLSSMNSVRSWNSIPTDCFKNVKKVVLNACNTAVSELSSFAAHFAKNTGVPVCGAKHAVTRLLSIDELKYTYGNNETDTMQCFDPKGKIQPIVWTAKLFKLLPKYLLMNSIYYYSCFKGATLCMKAIGSKRLYEVAAICESKVDIMAKKPFLLLKNLFKVATV